MEISFFWSNESFDREPGCRSDILNADGVDILACLLTDHGGQKYENSISWLNEGLFRLGQVKSGAIDHCDWSRDSWGAEINCGFVKIYSLYDENYYSLMSIDDFERALLGWKKFILTGSGKKSDY